MKRWLAKLFPIDRSLMGPGTRDFLREMSKFVDLKIHSFPSGQRCFDWTIPDEWKLLQGILKDDRGNIVIDASNNPLHVIINSESRQGWISRHELAKHCHFLPKHPSRIPYRTSYYKRNWGFCLSYLDFKRLTRQKYYVDIQTKFTRGELNIGEAVIRGRLDREVILSSYICHPRQANDGLSGVLVLLDLYRRMGTWRPKYTYRFFFMPETIGSLALLANGVINPSRTEYALVATCTGVGKRLTYKRTFLGQHSIDRAVEAVLARRQASGGSPFAIREYWPLGSDERQLSSVGIRIPTGSIMRTPYAEFSEYHTSADNADLVSIAGMREVVAAYADVIREYERYDKFKVNAGGGEPFLTQYGLYRTTGGFKHEETQIIRNWILHLADGDHNVRDMAARCGYTEEEILPQLKVLLKRGVIRNVCK